MARRQRRRRRLRVPLRRHRPRQRARPRRRAPSRAITAPPARSTSPPGSGLGSPIDPCASAVSALAEQRAQAAPSTSLRAPFDVRSIFDAARAGDAVAQEVVAEEARRIALHISPIAAVVDVDLVVLGGGVGRNGDLLLPPVRAHLQQPAALPAAPRGVEPGGCRGADGRARGGVARGARQRVRASHQLALKSGSSRQPTASAIVASDAPRRARAARARRESEPMPERVHERERPGARSRASGSRARPAG